MMQYRNWTPPSLVVAFLFGLMPACALAQEWDGPVRGSWVRSGEAEAGDVVIVEPGRSAEIVIGVNEAPPVRQAAEFLAGDIEKITGQRPEIVATASGDQTAIHLLTLAEDQPALPDAIDAEALTDQWEAHQIVTAEDAVWLVGSNARGTAFAAYTLCERLGVDPLHIWTGYRPERHERLVLKKTDYRAGPPTVKYRGLFHDDEDILNRPFEYGGYPLRNGDIPLDWYKRYFETALRLRMNMVAPFVRVHRRFEVQRTASDWGLFYTSHHYDIMLSNPYGFNRFGLAEARDVEGDWNWQTNREGMLKFWRGGVEENGQLDAIWPVGLRGTEDYPYPFPKDMPEAEQNRIFQEVIQAQIEATRDVVPQEKGPPVFHFTLYGEMLDKYLAPATEGGGFEMPEDVILIWCDDNDGRMRALPQEPGDWKHGVYYHLAYYGPVAKQSANLVPMRRIAGEFKRIVEAEATEFMLLNVSELREFVMGVRMIAEICWDAETALADEPHRPMPDWLLPHVPTAATRPLPPDEPSPAAERFIHWWSTEYFGEEAAADAIEAYEHREVMMDRWDKMWINGDRVGGAISALRQRFAGEEFTPARPETLSELESREQRYQEAFEVIDRAREKMNREQRQFFFDLVELPMWMDRRWTQSAILLLQAMEEPDDKKAWALCEEAMKPLEQLEVEILRAEHPPFEKWYRNTWIRHELTGLSVHRPYERLRVFLSSGGRDDLTRPPLADQPVFPQFLPLLKEEL